MQNTYLHRMVYVGKHKLSFGLEEFMKNLVTTQVEVTGFLLVYQSYFVHLVEGSESALTKHLRSVVDPDSGETLHIEKTKVIFEVAHINKRCLSSWSARSATPPSLVEQLGGGDRGPVVASEVARHLDTVLNKTLRLVDAIKKLPPGSALGQQLTLQLPQPELIQFLLDSPLLKDGRTLTREQRVPPRISLYDDTVWPVQSDFVPYNLFEKAVVELREEGDQDQGEEQEDLVHPEEVGDRDELKIWSPT